MGGGVSTVGDMPSVPQQRQDDIQKSIDGESDAISSPTAPLARILSLKSQEFKVKNFKSQHSLRAMALRQHSRLDISYISQDSVSQASFMLRKTSSKASSKNSSSSMAPLGSGSNLVENGDSVATGSLPSIPSSGVASIPSNSSSSTVAVGITAMRGKLNLKIQIDEPDWIQVSDDEGDAEVDGEMEDDAYIERDAKALGKHQSYLFTQSGTIFVDGFAAGIGPAGIATANTVGKGTRTVHKLPMKERLCMLCKLGQGASGVVYKALDLSEMRLVAVKMISVYDRSKRRQMVSELSALFQMLRSKNSEMKPGSFSPARLFTDGTDHAGFSDEPPATETSSSSGGDLGQNIVDLYDAFSNLEDGGVALMMEYMDGGSLQDIVDNGGCADESTLANIAVQGLQGLNFLHNCNQIHRDIKPGNLLINQYGAVKVSDLGILRQLDQPPLDSSSVGSDGGKADTPSILRANTFVGTATFMAPERIDGREYSFPSDVWSFGLTLMTVALGKLPIDTTGGYWSILHSIRDQKPPSLPDDGRFSIEFREFLSLMLQHDPLERPTCAELLKHPFLSKSYNEDISEGYAVEDGLQELSKIIMALTAHLDKLKKEIECPEIFAKRSHGESFITRALRTKSGCQLIEDALFGEATSIVSSDPFSPGKAMTEDRFLPADRLRTLSKQLRIPLDLALYTVRVSLSKDSSSESTNSASAPTPKASHFPSV